MSDYTKATNFASKDSLSTGNPLKIVKGTEIDTEFNNIQTAIATKADLNSPTFSGSVTIVGGTITGITDLAVADGGTGASDATTARSNLSAAKSGANSDITSITGLTTPLTVAQGGTGSSTLTANNVLLGNGTSALQAVAPGTSGNLLTSNGTTWTSASFSGVSSLNSQTGAVVTTTAYAIGSYVIGRPNSFGTTYNINDTVSGSSLYAGGNAAFNIDNGAGGWQVGGNNTTYPPNVGVGSWRCVSTSYYSSVNTNGYPGLWVRYA